MAAPNAPIENALSRETDEVLVEWIRQRDEVAFREIYERYFGRIYRFVSRRFSNRADTEEIVQEIFVNIFSSIHGYRGDAPFYAWVFGLARRTIANRFKRRRPRTVSLGEDEPLEVDPASWIARRGSDPLEAYEYRERLRRIQDAARNDLSREQRILFELHHLENRSIHEIAAFVHKTEDAVKSHLYRARRRLLAR